MRTIHPTLVRVSCFFILLALILEKKLLTETWYLSVNQTFYVDQHGLELSDLDY